MNDRNSKAGAGMAVGIGPGAAIGAAIGASNSRNGDE